jgi:hypothetical protein
MSIVTCTLDLTCNLIDLEKYLQKRQIVKLIKKVNDADPDPDPAAGELEQ